MGGVNLTRAAGSFAQALDSGGSGPGAGGGLAHAIEQILQDGRVVSIYVFGSEQKRQAFAASGQAIEFSQLLGGLGAVELFHVALPEGEPLIRPSVEPDP